MNHHEIENQCFIKLFGNQYQNQKIVTFSIIIITFYFSNKLFNNLDQFLNILIFVINISSKCLNLK